MVGKGWGWGVNSMIGNGGGNKCLLTLIFVSYFSSPFSVLQFIISSSSSSAAASEVAAAPDGSIFRSQLDEVVDPLGVSVRDRNAQVRLQEVSHVRRRTRELQV